MKEFGECRCKCHSGPRSEWSGHCFGPCCQSCPWCKKRLAHGYESHVILCERDSMNMLRSHLGRELTSEDIGMWKKAHGNNH